MVQLIEVEVRAQGMPVLMGLELNYTYGRIAVTVQSLCQTGQKREELAKKREIA